MDKLNDSGQIQVLVTRVVKVLGNEQQQCWPKPFATTIDDMMTNLINQDDIRLQAFLYEAINTTHFICNEMM